MKILLTGTTGYIGKRLLPMLIKDGHTVICCVRDKDRYFPPESLLPYIEIIEIDLLDPSSLNRIPREIDGAYYLVHSMSASKDYYELEDRCARNFKKRMDETEVNHVVYLSGIVNEENLSEHLLSRKNVEQILAKGRYNFTALRAGIVIGSGSASFEIIRDLVEKLPIMVAPKWLKTRCQPIGVTDVIEFLSRTLFNDKTYNANFDIGGPEILTYKEMLLIYAEVRKLKRLIFPVPIMTPRLSSYWLYFVTSTTYNLAIALVSSMKIEVIARDNKLEKILGISPISYKEALERAFAKIETDEIVSSWKDAQISGTLNFNISDFIEVPDYGCFKDIRSKKINNKEKTLQRIWSIGGDTGWYYGQFLWKLRGYLDKLFGGVGLKRGRTQKDTVHAGDAIDFWRVLYANKEEGRLLLFAEMKLPGEAWLEFKVKEGTLIQSAIFRPKGVLGRLYWYSVFIFHEFVFQGMLDKLVEE
jgi:uncharacterized protein YbjT (DUF2867 family)